VENEMKGKTALITGGSRGIGLAIARAVCVAGGNVMLVSRSSENLESAAASLHEFGDVVAWTVAHVAHSDEAEAAVLTTIERFGALDALVNNAGTNSYMGPLLGIDDVRMGKMVDTNQASVVMWSRATWNAWMSEHGGSILNVASIGGLGVEPGIGWYNVTKAAVIHLTRQLSWELAPNVRVNAIAPGVVRTDLSRAIWEGHEKELASRIPLGRIGEVDDIAPMALLLLSPWGSWITGQTIVIDGGTTNQPSGGVGI
jgi:NAD(P)-dependent dehydrogenase (short-subunit alcohol dehydrogenase family)